MARDSWVWYQYDSHTLYAVPRCWFPGNADSVYLSIHRHAVDPEFMFTYGVINGLAVTMERLRPAVNPYARGIGDRVGA